MVILPPKILKLFHLGTAVVSADEFDINNLTDQSLTLVVDTPSEISKEMITSEETETQIEEMSEAIPTEVFPEE